MESLVSHRVRIGRGSRLFGTGDTFKNLYVIRLGQIKTVEIDYLGIENVTDFHLPGASLGWDGIASGHFQMGAIALEDCEICVMPFDRVEAMCCAIPRLRQLLVSKISQRLVEVSRRALDAARRFLDGRFAAFIMNMSKHQVQAGYSPSAFHLRMSRRDLCSYLGTSPEGLSRIIATFRSNGWIRMTQRDLEILAPEQLRQLADGHPEFLVPATAKS